MDPEAVIRVYALRPLGQELVSSLDPDVDLADLAQGVSGVGCPQPDQGPARGPAGTRDPGR